MVRIKFRAAVSAACPERANGRIEVRPCQDIYVKRVSHLVQPEGRLNKRLPISSRGVERALILVLESPHADEYIGPPSPAKGSTGRNIVRYLAQVPGLTTLSGRPVVVMNAVQYQCSLGLKTAVCRDAVFTYVWTHGGRDDFVTRLRATYRKGDIVACCCTKGNFSRLDETLRYRVYGAICEVVKPPVTILRRTHPCRWTIHRTRNFEWKVAIKPVT